MKSKKLIRFIVSVILMLALVKISLMTNVFSSLNDLFNGFSIGYETIYRLAIMLLVVYVICNLINLVLSIIPVKNNRAKTMMTIVRSLTNYAALIFAVCFGLNIIGVDVSTIVASLGIVALVIGFGAESLIEDVITGLFMIVENQYNVGDIVEVNGFRGTVSAIGIRTTSITDTGGNVKIINNSNMKDILNRSNKTSVAVSEIQIPYETDIEAFENKLSKMMEDIYILHKDIMKSAPKYLGVSSLEASGISLKFMVEVEEKDIYKGQRILNRELLVFFRKANVEVPYPKMDVHNI